MFRRYTLHTILVYLQSSSRVSRIYVSFYTSREITSPLYSKRCHYNSAGNECEEHQYKDYFNLPEHYDFFAELCLMQSQSFVDKTLRTTACSLHGVLEVSPSTRSHVGGRRLVQLPEHSKPTLDPSVVERAPLIIFGNNLILISSFA